METQVSSLSSFAALFSCSEKSSRPSGSGVRIPPSVCFFFLKAEVTKRSNVRDSRNAKRKEVWQNSRMRFFFKDVVAEWLSRLTRNQLLSGAQVQVLPTSRGRKTYISYWNDTEKISMAPAQG